MTYHGQIRNGVIALDREAELPEGARVEVRVVSSDSPETNLRDKLLQHAGRVDDLPEDASEQLDHYLYGVPKR